MHICTILVCMSRSQCNPDLARAQIQIDAIPGNLCIRLELLLALILAPSKAEAAKETVRLEKRKGKRGQEELAVKSKASPKKKRTPKSKASPKKSTAKSMASPKKVTAKSKASPKKRRAAKSKASMVAEAPTCDGVPVDPAAKRKRSAKLLKPEGDSAGKASKLAKGSSQGALEAPAVDGTQSRGLRRLWRSCVPSTSRT